MSRNFFATYAFYAVTPLPVLDCQALDMKKH
jgi:hypothetical protein